MTRDADFSIEGKVALVTGDGSGLGAAIAEGFAARGAQVAIVSRKRERAREVIAQAGADRARFYGCDVTDSDAVEATVATIIEDLGGIDILVNAAGILLTAASVDLTDDLCGTRS